MYRTILRVILKIKNKNQSPDWKPQIAHIKPMTKLLTIYTQSYYILCTELF